MAARVVLFDIEASNLKANYGIILSFGWKFLGEKKVHCVAITDFKEAYAKKRTNDFHVVMKAKEVLESADVHIAHYGKKFDVPVINSRLLYHGQAPLPKIPMVDTWRIAKDHLQLNSNRLDVLAAFLGVKEKKTPLSGPIWIDAMAGDQKAIRYVVDHNIQDVKVLEGVYQKIKPLAYTHPNIALIERAEIDSNEQNSSRIPCKTCGVIGHLQSRGYNYAITGVSRRFQCIKCYSWSSLPLKRLDDKKMVPR